MFDDWTGPDRLYWQWETALIIYIAIGEEFSNDRRDSASPPRVKTTRKTIKGKLAIVAIPYIAGLILAIVASAAGWRY